MNKTLTFQPYFCNQCMHDFYAHGWQWAQLPAADEISI